MLLTLDGSALQKLAFLAEIAHRIALGLDVLPANDTSADLVLHVL